MTSPRDFPWTDENVERLKKLCAEGLSAGQIANVMNLTRNQAIGKLHRLGLSPRSRRVAGGYNRITYRPEQPKPQTSGTKTRNAMRATAAADKAAQNIEKLKSRKPPKLTRRQKEFILGVPLDALTDHRCGCAECISRGPPINPQKCNWPLNDPEPGKEFCGAKQMEGLPYCKHHATIAYVDGYKAALRRQASVIRNAVERARQG